MRVGIIITTFNNEHTILRCIKSIIKNFKKKIKIIIIDDCSSDNTISKIKKSKYNNYISKLYSNKKNLGVSQARNIGLKLCRNVDYVMFVDGDDYLNSRFYKFLKKKKLNEDLILFDFNFVNKNKVKKLSFLNFSKNLNKKNIKDIIIKNFQKPNKNILLSHCWSKLYRLNLIKKRKVFFKKKLIICEDGDFVLRFLSVSKKISYLKFPMINHSITSGKMNLKKLTFAVSHPLQHQHSFLNLINQSEKFFSIKEKKLESFKEKKNNIIAAYTMIYTIRSCLKINSFLKFIEVYKFWKTFYQKEKIKTAIEFYDPNKADGNKILPKLIKSKLYLLSILSAFLIARKRYL